MKLTLEIPTQPALDKLLAYLQTEQQEVQVLPSPRVTKRHNPRLTEIIAAEVRAIRSGDTTGNMSLEETLAELRTLKG